MSVPLSTDPTSETTITKIPMYHCRKRLNDLEIRINELMANKQNCDLERLAELKYGMHALVINHSSLIAKKLFCGEADPEAEYLTDEEQDTMHTLSATLSIFENNVRHALKSKKPKKTKLSALVSKIQLEMKQETEEVEVKRKSDFSIGKTTKSILKKSTTTSAKTTESETKSTSEQNKKVKFKYISLEKLADNLNKVAKWTSVYDLIIEDQPVQLQTTTTKSNSQESVKTVSFTQSINVLQIENREVEADESQSEYLKNKELTQKIMDDPLLMKAYKQLEKEYDDTYAIKIKILVLLLLWKCSQDSGFANLILSVQREFLPCHDELQVNLDVVFEIVPGHDISIAKGINLLGKALTQVREELLKKVVQ